MAGSSRGHWDVGKSAKKPRKEDTDGPFSLPGSPARSGLILPPQVVTNVASGAQEPRSHRLSIVQGVNIDGVNTSPPQQDVNVTGIPFKNLNY
jgi:hypothetical protein